MAKHTVTIPRLLFLGGGLALTLFAIHFFQSTPIRTPSPQTASTQPLAPCVITGCSQTVCAEAELDIVTTCEYLPEYACYPKAICQRQPDGSCGWTQTDASKACFGRFGVTSI